SRSPMWYPPGFEDITPARARIAREGVLFRDFYVNSIPCSPNRATTFTGLHAHQHWILDNVQTGISLDRGFPTIGSMLHGAGYRTFYFGTWHLTHRSWWRQHPGIPAEAGLQIHGFDVWRPQPGPIARDYEGTPNEGYELDDNIANSVVSWLASSD